MMKDSSDPPVRRVCAWCGKDMGSAQGTGLFMRPVTHGICTACDRILSSFEEVSLVQLLQRLDGPVVVVDGVSGDVLAAAEPAAAALGSGKTIVAGKTIGTVTECVHANEPAGCGRTEHCSGCTIRRLFTEVNETGRSVLGQRAYQHVVTPRGIRMRLYLISAQKLGDAVLMRIDPLPGDEEDVVI